MLVFGTWFGPLGWEGVVFSPLFDYDSYFDLLGYIGYLDFHQHLPSYYKLFVVRGPCRGERMNQISCFKTGSNGRLSPSLANSSARLLQNHTQNCIIALLCVISYQFCWWLSRELPPSTLLGFYRWICDLFDFPRKLLYCCHSVASEIGPTTDFCYPQKIVFGCLSEDTHFLSRVFSR